MAQEKLLLVNEVAEILRKSPWTVRQMLVRGEIVGFKSGNSWRVAESTVDEYIHRLENRKPVGVFAEVYMRERT